MSYNSHHSRHSNSSGDSKTDIISPPLRPQSQSTSSKFAAESMMECKVKELNEMIQSIAALKRSYSDQMKTKRVKCTELTSLEKQIGDQYHRIMSEFTHFRRKQASHGQNLQCKISELHELNVDIHSEKEVEIQSMDRIRSLLHQQQRQREGLQMAKSMVTRSKTKLDEFGQRLMANNLYFELFVQNEDLSLDDIDVSEYHQLVEYLTAFGKPHLKPKLKGNDSNHYHHDHGDGHFVDKSVSKMLDMVMEVDAVSLKGGSSKRENHIIDPSQDLTACILKAKEMRRNHEIISLRAQLTKQQQINRTLHAENERLVHQSNEHQLAMKSLVEDKKEERERNKLIRMLKKKMGDDLAAKEGEQDHWRQIEDLSEEIHRLRVLSERRTIQIGDLQKLVIIRDDEIKKLKTEKLEYERVLRANAMAHHTTDHHEMIEKMEIFQNYGGKQYVEEFCVRSKYERPNIELKHVANWKTGEQIWHCTISIMEIGMKQQYKSKQKAKAIYQCYQRLAGQVAKL